MDNYKLLTKWVIALNFFILIGAGHGIAFVGLLEFVFLLNSWKENIFHNEDISFSLTATYDKSLFAVCLFSLIGQVLLVASIIIRSFNNKIWVKLIGLIFGWIGFYYLSHCIFSEDLALLSFLTGVPYLFVSIVLLYKLVLQNKRGI